MITVYGLKHCGTTRKATAYLQQKGIDYHLQDIRTAPPAVAVLRKALEGGVPLRRLFNTSGGSYRDGGFKDRLPSMSAAEALAALAGDPMLIKRPVIETESIVLVGFREEEYRQVFEG